MPNKGRMAVCKHCGTEIAANAKVCPKCGGKNKKPIYKRLWFIVLVAIVLLGMIISANSDQPRSQNPSAQTSTSNTIEQSKSQVTQISYTPYSVSELMDDLNQNALSASEKYNGQSVELTGRLGVIDSSGDYISLYPEDNDFAIVGVQCFIRSEEQKATVMEMSIGDTLVVKGKIKSVGELMGYSLEIDEIAKPAG